MEVAVFGCYLVIGTILAKDLVLGLKVGVIHRLVKLIIVINKKRTNKTMLCDCVCNSKIIYLNVFNFLLYY